MSSEGIAVSETAYAKINLALHVRGRRGDGYHMLETLFVFADFGDELTFSHADKFELSIDGPFATALEAEAQDDNLIFRAARALRAHIGAERDGTLGARIELQKNLPVAAGIGGGSADAAAALRGLCRLWDANVPYETLTEIGAALGADVPACIKSETCRGEGVGDILISADPENLSGCGICLVNPAVPLSTAEVFAAWDGKDRGPLPSDDLLAAALAGRNDLELPARAICPPISDVLTVLADTNGTMLVRMSGSGATCFGLYASSGEAQAAKKHIQHVQPRWWVEAGALR